MAAVSEQTSMNAVCFTLDDVALVRVKAQSRGKSHNFFLKQLLEFAPPTGLNDC